MADHFAVGVGVLAKKVLCRFLLNCFHADGDGPSALLGTALWRSCGLSADPLGATLWIGGFMLWQFFCSLPLLIGKNALLFFCRQGHKPLGSFETLAVGKTELLGNVLLLALLL